MITWKNKHKKDLLVRVGLLFLSKSKSLIYDMKINLNSREGFYAIYGLMKKSYTLGEAINQIREENAGKS